jgi:hypothetical protein
MSLIYSFDAIMAEGKIIDVIKAGVAGDGVTPNECPENFQSP